DGLMVDPARPTTTKSRIVAHHQQIARLDAEERRPLPAEIEQALLAWLCRRLPDSDVCILSDYAKGVVTPRLAAQLIRLARQHHKPVLVDPKGADCLKYKGATIVKPNLAETERFVQREIRDEASFLEAGRQLVGLLDGAAVLVTRGPQGM